MWWRCACGTSGSTTEYCQNYTGQSLMSVHVPVGRAGKRLQLSRTRRLLQRKHMITKQKRHTSSPLRTWRACRAAASSGLLTCCRRALRTMPARQRPCHACASTNGYQHRRRGDPPPLSGLVSTCANALSAIPALYLSCHEGLSTPGRFANTGGAPLLCQVRSCGATSLVTR